MADFRVDQLSRRLQLPLPGEIAISVPSGEKAEVLILSGWEAPFLTGCCGVVGGGGDVSFFIYLCYFVFMYIIHVYSRIFIILYIYIYICRHHTVSVCHHKFLVFFFLLWLSSPSLGTNIEYDFAVTVEL